MNGARSPRRHIPWPYKPTSSDPLFVAGELIPALLTVALAIYGISATAFNATAWREAGAGDMNAPGAWAAQLIIVGVLLTAATLYRWGYPLLTVLAVGGFAAVLAVVSALAPRLAAGYGWAQTLLGVVFAFGFHACLSLAMALVARHSPLWWTGWSHRQ